MTDGGQRPGVKANVPENLPPLTHQHWNKPSNKGGYQTLAGRRHPGHRPGAGRCFRGGVTVIILTAAIMEHFVQSHAMLRLSHDAVPSPHLRAEERKITEAKVTASKGIQSQAAQHTPRPGPRHRLHLLSAGLASCPLLML